MSAPAIVVKGFLIVRANGAMRTVRQRPSLRLDEVAFPVSVSIPRAWGLVQTATSIEVSLPEPPDARVTVGDAVLDGGAA